MGDNLRIQKLRDDIVKTLNEAKLPIEVERLVLKEIFEEVSQMAQMTIQKEKESENEQSLRENKLAE
jgi:ribose 5-phosphate isomerase